MTDTQTIVTRFASLLEDEFSFAIPVAAIKVLTEFVSNTPAETLTELISSLNETITVLKKSSIRNPIPITAGCDLFERFISRTSANFEDFSQFKLHLIQRGKKFVDRAIHSRTDIAKLAVQFIKDDSVILVHSFSRVVMSALQLALQLKKRFTVYVTESRPSSAGLQAVEAMRNCGIYATLILDTAVGYVMGKVDCVLVGAEGVVENGGIINQIGTYQIALIAKANNVPFYCLAESFKFVRLFPINQQEIPININLVTDYKYLPQLKGNPKSFESLERLNLERLTDAENCKEGVKVENPNLDYTQPDLVTLLVTDLGVLTPSGVSDELIKLYL